MKKINFTKILFLFLCIAVVLLVGCDKPVESVSLNESEVMLKVGEIVTLEATVKPNDATDKSIVWSVEDSSIATVENGKITAKAKGQTIVTVTTNNGNQTASCIVKVEEDDPPANGTIVYKCIGYTDGDKIYYVSHYVGQLQLRLNEDSYVLTLNSSDETCTFKANSGEVIIDYTGTYTVNSDGELTLSLTAQYQGQENTVTVTGEIHNGMVAISLGGSTMVYLQDEKTYQPIEPTVVYKSVEINEAYGIGELYQPSNGTWDVLTENSYTLKVYADTNDYYLETTVDGEISNIIVRKYYAIGE